MRGLLLADEATGASLQAASGEILRILGSQHQDIEALLERDQPLDHLQSAKSGYRQFENHQIRHQAARQLQCLRAAVGLAHHLVAFRFHQQTNRVSGHRLFVDDKDAAHPAPLHFSFG
ncbi:hypothetical protein D9M68_955940 [compost metagenome]